MKKYLSLLLIMLTICTITIKVEAKANETIYYRKTPINIYTKPKVLTTIYFDKKIVKMKLGESSYFRAKKSKDGKEIDIMPKDTGISTNLKVEDSAGNLYNFHLHQNPDNEPIENYFLKSSPEIDYQKLIQMTNHNRISLSPSLNEVVEFYDINKNIYKLDKLDIVIKRLVKVKNDDRTIIWVRGQNNTDKNLKIPLESISSRDRIIEAVAGMKEKVNLKPKEFEDFYIIMKEAKKTNDLQLNFKINGELETYDIQNIPLKNREMKVFVKDKGQFINVDIDNYQYKNK